MNSERKTWYHTTSSSHYTYFILYIQPLKMELIEGSETSENHNRTPGKYPKEYIKYSKHGESLKSRIHYITLHYITLHYITLHYITLHYITLLRIQPTIQEPQSVDTVPNRFSLLSFLSSTSKHRDNCINQYSTEYQISGLMCGVKNTVGKIAKSWQHWIHGTKNVIYYVCLCVRVYVFH